MKSYLSDNVRLKLYEEEEFGDGIQPIETAGKIINSRDR
jgi:hypothetical protein